MIKGICGSISATIPLENMGNIFQIITRRNNNRRFPHAQRLHVRDDLPLMPIKVASNRKTVSDFLRYRTIALLYLDSCMTALNLT